MGKWIQLLALLLLVPRCSLRSRTKMEGRLTWKGSREPFLRSTAGENEEEEKACQLRPPPPNPSPSIQAQHPSPLLKQQRPPWETETNSQERRLALNNRSRGVNCQLSCSREARGGEGGKVSLRKGRKGKDRGRGGRGLDADLKRWKREQRREEGRKRP